MSNEHQWNHDSLWWRAVRIPSGQSVTPEIMPLKSDVLYGSRKASIC